MIKNKKTWYILGIAAVLVILIAAALLRPKGSGTYDNLIRNGDFEAAGNGLPRDWETDAYFPQRSYTTYDLADGMSGSAGHIVNHSLNDARFAQTVSVAPNTLYLLHGYIKADAKSGLGANLSIEGIYVFSDSVYDTEGEWQEVSLYGRTGPNQHSVTVYARLGGYSGEATGEAWFDDVTLNRVDSVASGFYETDWYVDEADDGSATSTAGWYLMLISVAYAALFIALLSWFKRQDRAPRLTADQNGWIAAGFVLALGLIVRLVVALRVPGYDVDIGCFRSWGTFMAEAGPARFYQEVGFCDYPPGYMWVLWLLGGLGRLLGTGVTEFMVKLPPILCDMALCVLIYTEGKKRMPQRAALALALLYALNPLTIVTGAAWGQADAVLLLLLFLVVLFALRGRWAAALPLYMAAVLVKPQALMFGPLGLAALIVHIVRHWQDADKRRAMCKDVLAGLGLLAVTAFALAGPFLLHENKPVSWLINLYSGTMSQYGYATVNACNLYFLLGKNWVGAETGLTGDYFLAAIVYCAAVLPMAAYVMTHTADRAADQAGRIRLYALIGLSALLAAAILILALLGALSYATLGTAMIAYDVAVFLILYLLGNDKNNLPLLGAALLLVLFNTASMMHERYLFPAVGLLLLAYALKKDKRILYLAVGVSIMGFLNIGCCLDRNIRIGGAEGHLNAPAVGISSDMALLENLAAIGNFLLGAYAMYLSLCLCRKDAPTAVFDLAQAEAKDQPAAAAITRAVPPVANPPLRKMGKKDWAVMLTVTVLYAVLAFTNLGATKAPQTAWVSSQSGETVTIDLGQERSFKMLFFNGIHWLSDFESAEFPVQVSSDGETWGGDYEGSVRSGDTFDCFSWKYIASPDGYGEDGDVMTGRYVRIISTFPELTIYEALFRDAETNETLPARVISDTVPGDDEGDVIDAENGTVSFLVDEPDTLDGEPGWYNSTYFDEIYHARTAYEHLHGLPVYETTHPPLGKVLMSFAIAIFGMTPFGWRFAGALAGVLMLPGMYLMGKLLIKKKWGGPAAMLLMAFDLMHFTQTRIATIDSFVVLFIIWSVYCMLRWFLLDYFHTDFKKTLIPLGLSGLFMGLAVASKWTGCYAGAGLAVLFFYGIWRRYREIKAARAIPEKKRSEYSDRAANGAKYLLITIGSCFLFFVAVPLLIYYASYIPYFASSGGVTAQKIIRAAEGMLDYHSTPGLGMDHSFYSPWYEWPVIGKPMWYYSGSFAPDGMASTIMALGNPAVWWVGLAGLFGVMALFVSRHYDEKNHVLTLAARDDDPRFALLLICFAAQYLPWVPVPRGTYIYHYFPSVPFIILCAELCLDWIGERWEKAARIAVIAWIALSAVLFIAFFPYASGVTVSRGWLEAMRWFPRWLWY
ncbi:MAG: glycosyltransferase family 39 protein [Clostridia bacterium]|nr:glycosyltransferase family 39 protein [Clostridia bacterium]